MKTFISLAVLALLGQAEAGVIQRRLNVQNLQFVPAEIENVQTGFLTTHHPHVFHEENYDEYETNNLIEKMGTANEEPYELDKGGQ